MQTQSLPSLTRRLLFSLVSALLLMGTLECGVRLFWTSPLEEASGGLLMEPHPSRLWALRPGETESFGAQIRVNSDRLRATTIEGHDVRVLTLGDSSVFGHGMNDADTPHQTLEDALAEQGVSSDVLSGATPGYSSIQALRLLDEVGWDQDPDLLLIGTLWSDNNFRERSDGDWLTLFDEPGQRIHTWMTTHLYLWAFLTELLTDQEATIKAVTWQTHEETSSSSSSSEIRRVSPSEYAHNLDRMLMQAYEHNAGALMLQPCNQVLLQRNAKAQNTSWSAYFKTMETIAERRGIPIVNGCEVILTSGLSAEEAFVDDMHPSAQTNRLYARAMAETLVEAGWPQNRLVPDPEPELWTYAVRDIWIEFFHLPHFEIDEAPEIYFEWGEQTQLIPLSRIESSDPRNKQVVQVGKTLKVFQAGQSTRRRPIQVKETSPGQYTVVHGSATFTVALIAEWEAIPADIVDEEESP